MRELVIAMSLVVLATESAAAGVVVRIDISKQTMSVCRERGGCSFVEGFDRP